MMTYQVKPGDSLSLISKTYYGDFSRVNEIAKLNNITNVDKIFPGQVLKLPDVEEAQVVESEVLPAKKKTNWIFWLLLAGGIAAGGYVAYDRYKKKKSVRKKIDKHEAGS